MRTLIVMRHAEAGRTPPGGGDRDRPLTEAGMAAARAMGALLARHGYRPDAACVSPARRTRQTWVLAAESFGDVADDCADDLYDADAAALKTVVAAAAARCGALMIVAHNPGVHQLALDLAGEQALTPGAADRLQRGFPPGAAAVFSVAADGGRRLEGFWTPADAAA